MFDLTSPALFVLTAVLAVVVPIVIVVLWARRRRVRPAFGLDPRALLRPSGSEVRALGTVAGHLGLIVLSQALALMSLGLWVNDQYGFYTSWADLFGRGSGSAQIATVPSIGSGVGAIHMLAVKEADTHTTEDTLVWTPPQYTNPHYRMWRFPVLMFLPGQPSSPTVTFERFEFAQAATRAIAAHQVLPFVAVFPPLMIRPPRDTECTNVPRGPQAESWLSHDVTQAVRGHYRVAPPGPHWSVMGFSTGGFCAAKLVLEHPSLYGAAVSLGGYFTPVSDHATGDLFRSSTLVREENSPLWLYEHGRIHSRHLLMVTGTQDASSWRSTRAMLAATKGDPLVSSLIFTSGGHNYRNYQAHLPQIFNWLTYAGAM
ncbi:MAG: alpha/beta hydrolase [Intrasporangium sp.]|uniref:alpha/beta hydrolase n=1 Tax=Intrasporangium sp. TaxID=1925024 RepID=UPI003F7E3EF9